MSKILAIDPGNEQSAWLLYDPEREMILSKGIDQNKAVLGILAAWEHSGMSPVHLAVEQIACMGMAVGATVFETVFWSGRMVGAWQGPWSRVKRHEVKMHLCGSMRAKDANIRQAIIDKLGAPGVKKNPGKTYGISKDLWAALAIAITFAETRCAEFESITKTASD